MMTLQYTCGILLLVWSVAVALPQEGKALKRRRVNHDEKNFELPSDVPGDSGEDVPLKFGRTIHQSAWSSEDAESSEDVPVKLGRAIHQSAWSSEDVESSEDVPVKLGRTIHQSAWSSEDTETSKESNENVRTRDGNKNRWSLSNALKFALDFVNKLRGRGSAFPSPDKNRKKKVPKYKMKNKSNDVHGKLFKKWLRKNKILKDGDSLSSYLLDHLNEYNHKKLRKKPKRKSSKNHSLNKKNNRRRNKKPGVNNKMNLTKVTKLNNNGYSDDEGQGSEKLSPLYKTKQYDTFSDENCDYSKSGDENEDNKSGDSCKHSSSEIAESLSSEADRHGKNNNNRDRKKSKITENSSQVITQLNAEYVPLSESQSKSTLKKNSNKPQTGKRAVSISNIATQTTDKNISPKNTSESITSKTTDKNMNSKATSGGIISKTADKSIASKTVDKGNTLKTTDKSIPSKIGEENTTLKPTDQSITSKTIVGSSTSNTVGESTASKLANENITSKTTEGSIASKTVDKSIASKTADESSTSKTTDKSITSKATSGNIASKNTNESLSSKTSNQSIASKTTDEGIVTKTTGESIISKTTDRSNSSKTTNESIASKSTDENIAKENSSSFPKVLPATASQFQIQEKSTLKEISKNLLQSQEENVLKESASDMKISQLEESEMNSYEFSEETDEAQSSENINVIKQFDRENVDKSHGLSSSKQTEEKLEKEESQLANNQSSPLIEKVEDENGERVEKYDTFLQYIYKNSNNKYFQALRKNSSNL